MTDIPGCYCIWCGTGDKAESHGNPVTVCRSCRPGWLRGMARQWAAIGRHREKHQHVKAAAALEEQALRKSDGSP